MSLCPIQRSQCLAVMESEVSHWIIHHVLRFHRQTARIELLRVRRYLYGEQKYAKYYPYKRVDVVNYSNMKYWVGSQNPKPALIQSEDYCNVLSQSGSFVFSRSKDTASTCSWSVTEGISFSESISMKFNVPFVSVEASDTTIINFSSTQSNSTQHVEHWGIDTTVPVHPPTCVKAIYTITETDVQGTLTSDIINRGFVTVRYRQRFNDHLLWWNFPSFLVVISMFTMPTRTSLVCIAGTRTQATVKTHASAHSVTSMPLVLT